MIKTNDGDHLRRLYDGYWCGLRCCFCSPEDHENPFIADGELHRKADYIIQNSTISRRRIRIADPDCTPPPLPPSEPQRDSGSTSVSQLAPGDVELILDAVNRPPTLAETDRRPDDDSTRLSGATSSDDGGGDHDGVDRPQQRTPSPSAPAATNDGDVDVKAETSTAESDRVTTSLLHGSGSSSSQGRCHCCAVQ